jgi:hypothetical protein
MDVNRELGVLGEKSRLVCGSRSDPFHPLSLSLSLALGPSRFLSRCRSLSLETRLFTEFFHCCSPNAYSHRFCGLMLVQSIAWQAGAEPSRAEPSRAEPGPSPVRPLDEGSVLRSGRFFHWYYGTDGCNSLMWRTLGRPGQPGRLGSHLSWNSCHRHIAS